MNNTPKNAEQPGEIGVMRSPALISVGIVILILIMFAALFIVAMLTK